MNNVLRDAEKALAVKKAEYDKAHKKWAKLRDADALPKARAKYDGKFFRLRWSNNAYILVIRMKDTASGEVVEFSKQKEGLFTSWHFTYRKDYYLSSVGKEITKGAALQEVKQFIEQVKDLFPVELRDL